MTMYMLGESAPVQGVLDGSASPGEGLIWAGDTSWLDYAVETSVTLVQDPAYPNAEAGVVVRYQDSSNFYWVGLGCWGHRVSISKKAGGLTSELAFDGFDSELEYGRTYNLKVVVTGNLIQFYVDGVLALEYTDTALPLLNGAIGYRVYNSRMQADYIHAYATGYTLQITAGDGGTTSPAPGTYPHQQGESVSVTAVASTGYTFWRWLLNDVEYSGAEVIEFAMPSMDSTLLAEFSEVQEYELVVTCSVGGTTNPPPTTYKYLPGEMVTVTAIPDEGYEFSRWILDGVEHLENPLSFQMHKDRSIRAEFHPVGGPPAWVPLLLLVGSGLVVFGT
jgi:hypothetical protein